MQSQAIWCTAWIQFPSTIYGLWTVAQYDIPPEQLFSVTSDEPF